MGIFRKKKNNGKKKSFIRRLFKWLGITILTLLILIILIPILFKSQIIEAVKTAANDNLNATVDFGEVDLTLLSTFPNLTLSINDVSVKNNAPFEGTTLADIENTSVTLDLWSVIFGDQMEINSISLIKPNLHVKVLEDGSANYDITIADTSATEEVAESEESAPFKLELESIKIEDGNIIYDDAFYATYVELNDFDHEGQIGIDDVLYSITTESETQTLTLAYDGIEYLSDVHTSFNCALDINMPESEMKITFKENEAVLDDLGLSLDGWLLMNDELMDMDLKFATNNPTFKSLLKLVPGVYSPDFGDMKTDGKVAISGFAKGKYTNEVMPGFDLTMNVDNAWFQYPDLPGKVDNINVDVNVSRTEGADLNNTKVDINKFTMAFLGNKIDARMKLRNLMSDPNIDGKIESYMDLAKLKDVIPTVEGESYNGIITSDVVLKGNVSALENEKYDEFTAEGDLAIKQMEYTSPDLPYLTQIDSMLFQFSPQFLKLANFDAHIGQSDLHADGDIDNYMGYFLKDEALKGSFNLTSQKFDMDELMGSTSETTASTESTSSTSSESVDTASYGIIMLPENVDFTMNTSIKEMIYDSLPIQNVNGTIFLKEGVADLNKFAMDVFEGSIAMTGKYAPISSEKAHIDFGFDIKNLDIPKSAVYFNTIEKMAPIAKNCKGKFSTDLTMNTDIDGNMEPIYETLNGKGTLRTNKVEVDGFPAMQKLGDALKVDWLKKQTIDNLLVTYSFHDGRIWVDPYDLKLGKATAKVEGSTSFKQEMDYTMDMKLPKGAVGQQATEYLSGALAQAGVEVDNSNEIPVKVFIKGTATDPKVTTDMKDQGKNVVNDIVDQGKDKLYEEAQKILVDAQAQADKILAEAKAKDDALRATGKESADKIRKEGENAADKIRKEGKTAGEKVRSEGYAQAQKLIDEANNPIAKKAAEKAAEKLRKETDKKADAVIAEANKKADQTTAQSEDKASKIEDEANQKADGIESAAQQQADNIMNNAREKAEKIKE